MTFSDNEGLGPDQPAFSGLFRLQVFKSLLFKAQNTTRLGCTPPTQEQVLSELDLTIPY